MSDRHEINFPALTFTAPGQYVYTIKELTPSSEIWEADSRSYKVVVTVTQGDDGKLIATADYPDGPPQFVNKYRCNKPCNPCKCFDRMAFPMLWFTPPQRPEFMALVKQSPEIFDWDWWQNFFDGICGGK